ncbi:hypothetical protein [Streptomyces zaomyceticus]|uniref:hypothetical protein n=1 Tax=Streptomyces zaomyceticus TaxID=68286 RepID=UPI00167BBB59|nr:hypothetical protein [Streptomyces zaomyceticus]GHG15221.1 hypothetical protein GCM10018791_32020 [Streptomyces zaomyceticus]
MGEELVLASKWDAAFDVLRFLYVGFFSDLPAWARYTVLGIAAAGFGGLAVVRLRGRLRGAPKADGQTDTRTDTRTGGTTGEKTGDTADDTAGPTDEALPASGTRVR